MLELNLVANTYKNYFIITCKALGLKINEEKNVYGTKIDFLGIKIDFLTIKACLSKDKLLKTKT